MAQQIQIRRDTSTNWTSANPILAQGELGLETNTNKIKIGNGTTAWNSLNYFGGAGALASLSDVTITSLASGQVLVANASSIFINQSLVSLVNEVVSFASLGSLAVMNQLSFTSLLNQPSLSSLAFQATIDYTTAQLTNKPALGSLAVMNQLSFTSLTNQPSLSSLAFQATIDYTSAQLTNKPALGSLAVMNQLSFTSLTNQPSLSSLAFQATIDYTSAQLTNKPSLGSLAVMNQLSFSSLLNQPSLGSLAYLSSISQIHLPSTASFNNLTVNGIQVNSTASINQIRSTGIITGTATMTQLNSGVYNLYESTTFKAIFDGTYGGRFRAQNSGETFLFENYDQIKMTDNLGQEAWKIDGSNFIIGRTLFANVGTQNFGAALATTLEANELITRQFRSSSVSTGLINTATANTSTLNAGIVVTNTLRASTISTGLVVFSNATGNTLNVNSILASLVSISNLFGGFGVFDTVTSGTGTFDSANASTLNFDSAIGLYMGLGGGLSSQALYIDATNSTYARTAINFPSTASTYTWIGHTFNVNNAFSGGLYRRVDNADIGIWTQGSGNFPRVLVRNNGRVRIGIDANTDVADATLHIDQLGPTEAIPTLQLEQGDLSEEFINFVGSLGSQLATPITTQSTATTIARKVRVSANGSFFWLYLYNG